MRPPLLRLYPAYGIFPNAIINSYDALQTGISSNRQNLFAGKFCRSTLLSAIGGSMDHSISLVSTWRVPSQIFQSIVFCISIIVAALMSDRRRTAKCKQNKAMHFPQLIFAFFPEHDIKAVFAFIFGGLLHLTGNNISYIPQIRYLINTLVIKSCSPFFGHMNSLCAFHNRNIGIIS